jgi:hypothetical protein
VGLLNVSSPFAKRQPIVVVDQKTGRRQLIWTELDGNATRRRTFDGASSDNVSLPHDRSERLTLPRNSHGFVSR